MVMFRCTQKLLRRIGPRKVLDVKSTTKLGDWTVAPVGVGWIRLLLYVSETTRLPVLTMARDVKNLARNFPPALGEVLQGLGISAPPIELELDEMREASFSATNSRSILGSVNDFARLTKYRLGDDPNANLVEVSLYLSETPVMIPFRGESPQNLTRALFAQGANSRVQTRSAD